MNRMEEEEKKDKAGEEVTIGKARKSTEVHGVAGLG